MFGSYILVAIVNFGQVHSLLVTPVQSTVDMDTWL